MNRFLDRVYRPDRVLHPLVRVGAKGEGRFEQVTWETATSLIAERLQKVIETSTEARRSSPGWTPAPRG